MAGAGKTRGCKLGHSLSRTGSMVTMAVGAYALIAAHIIFRMVVIQRLMGDNGFGRTGGSIRNGHENKGSEDERQHNEKFCQC